MWWGRRRRLTTWRRLNDCGYNVQQRLWGRRMADTAETAETTVMRVMERDVWRERDMWIVGGTKRSDGGAGEKAVLMFGAFISLGAAAKRNHRSETSVDMDGQACPQQMHATPLAHAHLSPRSYPRYASRSLLWSPDLASR